MKILKSAKLRIINTSLIIIILIVFPSLIMAEKEKNETVEIPVDTYNKLIREAAKSVILPLKDYRSILEEISALKPVARSTDNYTVIDAQYKLTMETGLIVGSISLTVDVYNPGWSQLAYWTTFPLQFTKDVNLNDTKADYLISNGYFWMLFNKKGRNKLEFNFYSKINNTGKETSLYTNLINGVRTSMVLTVPENDIELKLDNGTIVKTLHNKNETVFHMLLDGNRLNFKYHKKELSKENEEAAVSRIIGNVSSAFNIEKNKIIANHVIAHAVQKGILKTLSVTYPSSYRLTDLIGENIRDYKTSKIDSGRTRLTVELTKPEDDAAVFLLQLESDFNGASLALAQPVIESVSRQDGWISIGTFDPAYINPGQIGKYNRIDTRELPSELLQLTVNKPHAGFRYTLEKKEIIEDLPLDIEFPPSAEMLTAYIKKARAETLMTQDGRYINRINYELVTESEQSLQITPQAGDELLSIYLNGQPINAAEENKQIIIPLNKSGISGDTYMIEYVIRSKTAPFNEEGSSKLSLPSVVIPVRAFEWKVYLPHQYSYDEFTGTVTHGAIQALGTHPEIKTVKWESSDTSWNTGKSGRRENAQVGNEDSGAPAPVTGDDRSADNLSLKIEIPTNGRHFMFYSMLMIGEAPTLNFEYEMN
ncbi:MAG: hypothetical protein JW737_04435 [Acidobacteria bacterium]|nr:hypothetical protein [Acidobacteriota bacterium]